MKRGEFSRRVRQQIWDREDGSCACCGRVITEGMWYSMQHRKARGAGGTHRVMTAADGVLLCGSATSAGGCHQRVESEPEWAAVVGYRVAQWEDVHDIPMQVAGYGQVYLTADGGYLPVHGSDPYGGDPA